MVNTIVVDTNLGIDAFRFGSSHYLVRHDQFGYVDNLMQTAIPTGVNEDGAFGSPRLFPCQSKFARAETSSRW